MEGLMLPFNKERKEYILSKNLWHLPLPLGAEARLDCLIDRETHTTRKQCLMTSLIMTHTETNTARSTRTVLPTVEDRQLHPHLQFSN